MKKSATPKVNTALITYYLTLYCLCYKILSLVKKQAMPVNNNNPYSIGARSNLFTAYKRGGYRDYLLEVIAIFTTKKYKRR